MARKVTPTSGATAAVGNVGRGVGSAVNATVATRSSGQATTGVTPGSGAGTLRYPQAMGDTSDYMVFRHMEYRTNKPSPNALGGAQGSQAPSNASSGSGAAPPEGSTIILYMPNSTPIATNSQQYQEWSAPGPLGELRRELGYIAGNAVMETNISSVDNAMSSVTQVVERVKAGWTAQKENAVPAVRQVGMNLAGAIAGTSAANLLATTKGQVYNPNIETIYQSPQRRSFSFSFIFVPTSAEESATVNNIIYEFKKWSTPEDIGRGFYKVPHVWEVMYMNAGKESKAMNIFKKMVITGVSVQDNPTQNMHMTFADGQPVVKSMTLGFQEVDVITRNDLEEGLSRSAVSY